LFAEWVLFLGCGSVQAHCLEADYGQLRNWLEEVIEEKASLEMRIEDLEGAKEEVIAFFIIAYETPVGSHPRLIGRVAALHCPIIRSDTSFCVCTLAMHWHL
jgi:hypothetical protein